MSMSDTAELLGASASTQKLAPLRTVRDLQTVTYHLVIENLTAMVHSSGTCGNDSVFMSELVYDPEHPGMPPEDVPCLTGNSLRHALREATAWLTLRLLDTELGSITPAAWHFLVSGGALGKGAATLDVEAYRSLRDTFPYLGLFGGGTGTALTPGKLSVDYAVLLCRQNASRITSLCPALAARCGNLLAAEDLRERKQSTRHDARRLPVAAHLLPAAEVETWDRTRHQSARENEEEGTDTTQMIYAFEAVAAGAQWYWNVGGRHLTPLEHSTLVCGLLALAKRGHLGAKEGTGHGRVRISGIAADGVNNPLADGLEAASRDVQIETLTRTFAAPYVEHVETHRKEIGEFLGAFK